MRTVMILVCAVLCVLAGGCSNPTPGDRPTVETDSGLEYQVIREGSGPRPVEGQWVRVDESTSLPDGTLIFSTWDTGQPVRFQLGAEMVVDGMEEIVYDMRVGEKRNAIMPPAITKRQRYPNVFGPDDTLHFVIELVEIE